MAKYRAFLCIFLFTAGIISAQQVAVPLDSAQRRHIDLRYGALMHFSYNTFKPGWGENIPDAGASGPLAFNPRKLDCTQWARIFKASKMKYGILTAKHHDGFCIWPSKAVPPNGRPLKSVAASSIPTRDVVKEYSDAFRAAGLEVGLYFSMWDASNGVGNGSAMNASDTTGRTWTAAESLFVTTQLTELLTNYGEICILMIDGWDWTLGHRYVPYPYVRKLVKKYQPNCLLTDMNGLLSPWEVDIVFVEEPKGGPIYAPPGNVFPMCQSPTLTGGWFFRDNGNGYDTTRLMSIADVKRHLTDLEPRYTNLLLNVPPDTNGLITPACSTRLAQVAAAWSPNPSRRQLPKQMHTIEFPITPSKNGRASSVSTVLDKDGRKQVPYFAFNGLTDCGGGGTPSSSQALWQSADGLPQWVDMDLGRVCDSLNIFGYLPRQDVDATYGRAGTITRYHLLMSQDGSTYDTVIKNATWKRIDSAGNPVEMTGTERNYRVVEFANRKARYVRLVALATVNAAGTGTGTFATVSEMDVGRCPLHDGTQVAEKARSTRINTHSFETAALFTGNRFAIHKTFAGKKVVVSVYDLNGKLLATLSSTTGAIDLRGSRLFAAAGARIVRVNPLQ
jgi:alpha-L-fucosidase